MEASAGFVVSRRRLATVVPSAAYIVPHVSAVMATVLTIVSQIWVILP